ncbi:relA-associated inhibitor [Rhea pennata]|uniref:relA-associated inhibitor n=1 Tax=Rhea pennata TaxID=8795 RepID=UPI002E271BA5
MDGRSGAGGPDRAMASQRIQSAQDLLDLTFQSLAMKHMDLKQVELDTAVAKVDELSRQLESLWTDGPEPPAAQPKEPYSPSDTLSRTSSPFGRKNLPAESPELFGSFHGDSLGRPGSPRSSYYLPAEERAPSPRPKVLAVPYEGLAPGGGATGRAPSPRLHRSAGAERPYDFLGFGGSPGRAGSPRSGEGSPAQMFFPERAPSPRPPAPPPYEAHSLYPSISGALAPFRAQDDLVIKRRPQKSWNESDLDVAYEKKPSSSGGYDRAGEGQPGLRQPPGLQLAPWRESSLDGAGGQRKDGAYGVHSATLPRNYKVSPLASERRQEGGGRRAGPPGPRAWHPALQPASRVPVPPPPGSQGARPPRHKPLPLSMIFKLQNAFWEHGGAGGTGGGGSPRGGPPAPLAFPRSPQKQPQLQAPPAPPPSEGEPAAGWGAPASAGPSRAGAAESVGEAPRALPEVEPEPELETLLQGGEAEDVARPLSPTRLQPLLPPEAQKVPEFEEVARVLAEMPRPLKRRGSMEQSPGPALPPTHKKQYQQLITRLFHHRPRKDETPAPDAAELPPGADAAPEAKALGSAPRHSPPPSLLAVPEPPGSPLPSPERRSALRSPSSPRKRPKGRVRLNPLVLLLDAALTGELDVVQQAVAELHDPSQPNDEGITALHNAICGANYNVVDFLIASGADVNSPDSHGWTPLHCAASCNDTAVCVALVRHGAAVFATTASDGSLAVEKCDPYREGYADCYNYLCEVEQSMGVLNSGVVYALWDYSAELGDELSFREGEPVTVLRRDPPEQLDWWWGSLYGHEGYVPKNYFGLFPRVRPQRKKV